MHVGNRARSAGCSKAAAARAVPVSASAAGYVDALAGRRAVRPWSYRPGPAAAYAARAWRQRTGAPTLRTELL
ncbi:hypothetical protein TPA0905_10790 [Streptomyces olivaceus]|nr:hypothetical protein TPA0905_10790 [Streptomyces olivaceus]